ncbi:hypothetical protein D3C76_1790390 [compost metagenome]
MRVVLFEQQHAHAEDGAGAELFPQTVRHRAQVFAKNDGLVAMGLKGQQAQQVVKRVIQISAIGGR